MSVVICGEALVDLVAEPGSDSFVAHPGGSPANTAVALARLGTDVAFVGRLATDPFGRQLRHHLSSNGVDLRYAVEAEEPASLAVVTVGDGGAPEYAFYVTGTADWQWSPAELPADFPPEVTAIHAGSLALARPPGGEVLTGLLRRERDRRAISVDPNVRPALSGERDEFARRMEGWVSIAHVVKVSDEDLAWVYPGQRPAEIARRWRSAGPALVVVTRGGDGALAFVGDEELSRPAAPAVVVDTIGAGDSFTAGLLDWLDRHDRLGANGPAALTPPETAAAVDFALAVAAVTVSRPGAQPPYRHEVLR